MFSNNGPKTFAEKGATITVDPEVKTHRSTISAKDISDQNFGAEKVRKLNQTLLAVRNVNQLITHEHDLQTLLEQACLTLVNIRGFSKCCITAFDCFGEASAIVEEGRGIEFTRKPASIEIISGSDSFLPEQVTDTYNHPNQPNNSSFGAYCQISEIELKNSAHVVSAPMRHRNSIKGMVSIWVPSSISLEAEEIKLLQEMADDIGFALNNLELDSRRQKAENALSEEIALRSKLFEQMPVGIVIVDPNTAIFLEFNSLAHNQLGYTREEFSKMSIFDVEAKESADDTRKRIASVELSGWVDFETIMRTKQGELRDVQVTTQVVHVAQKTVYQCIWRDITDHKRAEVELQKYALMANYSRDIILFLSRDEGRILMANLAGLNAYGYDSREILTKTVRELRSPDSLDSISGELEKADTEGILFETKHRRKDGSTFPVEVSSRGATIGGRRTLISIIRDITERKQFEKQNQDLQHYLELQVDRMPLALIVFDQELHIKSWNPAARRTFGFSSDEVMGKHPYDLIVPQLAQPDTSNTWLRLKQGDENAHSINENITKDGRMITCEWFNTPLKNDDGAVIGVLSMVEDITEQKKYQEQLARSSRGWRTTFDSITEMVSISDIDNRLIRVNKAYADYVNMTPKELIGKRCHELMHCSNKPPANCPITRTIVSRKPSTLEFNDAQQNIHLEESVSPILDKNDNITGIVRVARDVTERKKMEDKLIVADRLASIGELVAGVAHELNNPLTTVIGFSEMLAHETNIDVIKEELGIINQEAKRTSAIVKNLLTFARKHAPVKQSSSITKAIDEVLNLRSYEQKVHNIEVVKYYSADLPEILVDYFQIQQVFLNLIVNAEQAMQDANGRGILTINTEHSAESIIITFKDDGPGILPENMSKIFNPFFTTKDVGKGTGLGLSICHGIITSHGGTIMAKSEVGKGTQFIVQLPVDSERQSKLQTDSHPYVTK